MENLLAADCGGVIVVFVDTAVVAVVVVVVIERQNSEASKCDKRVPRLKK